MLLIYTYIRTNEWLSRLMIDQIQVGARISAIRGQSKQTQKSFSDSVGISLRALQNYEKGERKIPADLLITICRMYDVDPYWVMEGPGTIPRKSRAGSIDIDILVKSEKLIDKLLRTTGQQIQERKRIELVAEAYQNYLNELMPENDVPASNTGDREVV